MNRVDDRSLPATIGRPGPVLVMFTASWCRPCVQAMGEFRALAARLPDVAMAVADLDETQHAALAADVQGLPSLVLWRDGGLAGKRLGCAPAGAWADWLRAVMAGQADGELEQAA